MPANNPNFSRLAFFSYNKGITNVLVNEVYVDSALPDSTDVTERPGSAKMFKAIWDTGATNTVISQNVIDTCGLKQVSFTQVKHCGGETEKCPCFYIDLFLPNKVFIPSLKVARVVLDTADVLVGMDIMNHGDFLVTNHSGRTFFQFRMPSRDHRYYVPPNKECGVKLPSRNKPCPCGSGKTYKRCCGI